tara:strand:+ start:1576 stop:2391 length:816 start_codon:yes stop_codon:yes gene_type:complete
MAKFFDADNFAFVPSGNWDEHLIPIHSRDLGKKEGNLYPDAKWSDVIINGVALEDTFRFEDSITEAERSMIFEVDKDKTIMINDRQIQSRSCHELEEIPEINHEKKWINRMERMTLVPLTFKDAKKKKKNKERYPVKPKGKKEVRDEKIFKSSDKLQEIIDVKDTNGMEDLLTLIHKDDKTIKYCPPQHWIEPVVQWDKIWSEIDEIKMGKVRDHHYIEMGHINEDGIQGPAIYFFDKDSDDLNYNFNWERDFIQGPYDGHLYTPEPFSSY